MTYTYPLWAHLQKLITVGVASAIFFTMFALAKRLDVRISKASVVA